MPVTAWAAEAVALARSLEIVRLLGHQRDLPGTAILATNQPQPATATIIPVVGTTPLRIRTHDDINERTGFSKCILRRNHEATQKLERLMTGAKS
jgi:hypothetical protein